MTPDCLSWGCAKAPIKKDAARIKMETNTRFMKNLHVALIYLIYAMLGLVRRADALVGLIRLVHLKPVMMHLDQMFRSAQTSA